MKIYAVGIWEGTWGTERDYTYLASEFYTEHHKAVWKAQDILASIRERANEWEYVALIKDIYDEDVRNEMRKAGDYKVCYIVEHMIIE